MTVTTKTRRTLHERAGDACEVCGIASPPPTNAHHRCNRSQGGNDELSNLLLVCGSGTTGCHGRITVNPTWAASMGYTVPRGVDPRTVEVVRWSRWHNRAEVVLLDDEGLICPTL